MNSRREEYSRDDKITANLENGLWCENCAQSLILNDASTEGIIKIFPKDGKARISFPTKEYFGYLRGGAPKNRSLVTLPFLPELSDGFRFCCKVKAEFYKAYSSSGSWKLPEKQASFQVSYIWPSKPDPFDYGTHIRHTLETLELILTLCCSSLTNERVKFSIAASSSSDLCRAWLHIEKIPLEKENSFTERKFTMVQDWVNECAFNLEFSNISNLFKPSSIPSRLLDISSKDNDDSFIKLGETKTLNLSQYATRVRYIYLNYRWGTDEKLLKTTKEDIEQHKGHISIDFNMPLVSFRLVAYSVEPLSKDSDDTVAIRPGSSIALVGKPRDLPWSSPDCDHIPKLETQKRADSKLLALTYYRRMADEDNEGLNVTYGQIFAHTTYFTDLIPSLEDFEGKVIDRKLKLF